MGLPVVNESGSLLRAKLPNLDHTSSSTWNDVYEPSDDTYLLLDVLLTEMPHIKSLQPRTVLEIGCGSGTVITWLATQLGDSCKYYATDRNPTAVKLCGQTASQNNVQVEVVQTDLVEALKDSLSKKIDVLIFNPPYVPTPSEEVHEGGIVASWSGGIRGREVIDRLLPMIGELLSGEAAFYMVVVKENDPEEIASILEGQGLVTEVAGFRKAANEHLSILRIRRKSN